MLPAPEVLRYLDYLSALASKRPELLLAHSYTQVRGAGMVLRQEAEYWAE